MRVTLIALAVILVVLATGCSPQSRSSSTEGRDSGGFASIADACARESSVCDSGSKQPSGPLPPELTRPLRLPRIAAGQRCPATPGIQVSQPADIRGVYLGTGPVRPKVSGYQPGGAREALSGIARLDPSTQEGWRSFKTLWAVNARYKGPVMIRGARLDAPGSMFFGEGPTAPQLIIPAGQTLNEYDGTRTAPGATYVHTAGCYGYQIDGPHLSEIIIVKVIDPPS